MTRLVTKQKLYLCSYCKANRILVSAFANVNTSKILETCFDYSMKNVWITTEKLMSYVEGKDQEYKKTAFEIH